MTHPCVSRTTGLTEGGSTKCVQYWPEQVKHTMTSTSFWRRFSSFGSTIAACHRSLSLPPPPFGGLVVIPMRPRRLVCPKWDCRAGRCRSDRSRSPQRRRRSGTASRSTPSSSASAARARKQSTLFGTISHKKNTFVSQPYTTRTQLHTHTVSYILRCSRADRVVVGACNPTVVPVGPRGAASGWGSMWAYRLTHNVLL